MILATRGEESWPHLVIYGHYDAQPPDPLDLWTTKPSRRRSAKEGFLVEARPTTRVLRSFTWQPFTGCSPKTRSALAHYLPDRRRRGDRKPKFQGCSRRRKSSLEGDLLLVSDTGSPGPDQLVVTTGLRGLAAMEVKVFGPRQDLHSGVHGGALLNPLQAIMKICASLHDEHGNAQVPGFYDDAIAPEKWEREELTRLPLTEAQYAEFLGVPEFHSATGYSPLEAIRFCPTLEFNGVGGGYQGEGSKTVIPAEAFAKITCRLVPDQNSEDIAEKVKRAILDACPSAVRCEVEVKGGETLTPWFPRANQVLPARRRT